jgi:hypothetical protein
MRQRVFSSPARLASPSNQAGGIGIVSIRWGTFPATRKQ